MTTIPAPTVSSVPVMQPIKNGEKWRKYIFPNDQQLMFNDVTHVGVSARGTHRLQLLDGTKVIVPAGFLAITLQAEEWSI